VVGLGELLVYHLQQLGIGKQDLLAREPGYVQLLGQSLDELILLDQIEVEEDLPDFLGHVVLRHGLLELFFRQKALADQDFTDFLEH